LLLIETKNNVEEWRVFASSMQYKLRNINKHISRLKVKRV